MTPLPGIITLTRNQTSISVLDLESVSDLGGITGMHLHLITTGTITGIIQVIPIGMAAEDIIRMGIITIHIAHPTAIMVVDVATVIILEMGMMTTMEEMEITIMAQGLQEIQEPHHEDHLQLQA